MKSFSFFFFKVSSCHFQSSQYLTVPNMKTLFLCFLRKFCQCSVVFGLAIGSRVRYTEWVLSCVPFFCNPMDCSPPGSSVHENFQARILECIAISCSRGSSDPGIETASPLSPELAGGFLTTVPPEKPITYLVHIK